MEEKNTTKYFIFLEEKKWWFKLVNEECLGICPANIVCGVELIFGCLYINTTKFSKRKKKQYPAYDRRLHFPTSVFFVNVYAQCGTFTFQVFLFLLGIENKKKKK